MTYRVRVTREGRYWVGSVDGVRGGATEARTLSGLQTEVADLLAGLMDVDPESLDLEWDYSAALGAKAAAAISELGRARGQLSSAQRRYEHAQAGAVRELKRERISVRDSQELIGLSFQRVSQLARRLMSPRR